MDCAKADIACGHARFAAARGASFAAGPTCRIRARRGRARSAADRRDLARCARRLAPSHQQATRLCRPARFDRADAGWFHAALMLDSFFALHPAMPEFARMLWENMPRHPCGATSYRDRSHFDGQDVLESGFCRSGPGAIRPGSTRAGSVCRAASA